MVGRPISFWEDTFFRGYIGFREGSRLKHETSVCKQTSLLVTSLPLLPKRVEHVVFWKLLLCQYLSGTHKYASWTCHNFTYYVHPLQAGTLRTNVHPHDFKTKTHRIIFANDKFKLFLYMSPPKKYMRRILNSAKNNTFPNLKVSGHFFGAFPVTITTSLGFSQPATWSLCPMVTSLPRNTGKFHAPSVKGSIVQLTLVDLFWMKRGGGNSNTTLRRMSWNWCHLMVFLVFFCSVTFFEKKRDTFNPTTQKNFPDLVLIWKSHPSK